jgi:hypothetical protein
MSRLREYRGKLSANNRSFLNWRGVLRVEFVAASSRIPRLPWSCRLPFDTLCADVSACVHGFSNDNFRYSDWRRPSRSTHGRPAQRAPHRKRGTRQSPRADKQAAASLLAGLGLGTAARVVVSNLAKLVPVWGSVFGASASFASSWALGQIADKYFESGMKTAMTRSDFKAAEADGCKAHDIHKDLVESKRRLHEMALQTLGSSLKAGRITQQEYSARVEQLA